MTLQERCAAYATAFPDWPASKLRTTWEPDDFVHTEHWTALEQGRDVAYGVWIIGNDYRNRTEYHGAYPRGFLERLMALFPDKRKVLHAYSGSLPGGDYTRMDIRRELHPDVLGSVYDVGDMRGDSGVSHLLPFDLVCADPPYTDLDAKKYGCEPVDRYRATSALAAVVAPGGHLAWLDICWPMHSKTQWVTIGRIYVQRSTNHCVRALTLFESVGTA